MSDVGTETGSSRLARPAESEVTPTTILACDTIILRCVWRYGECQFNLSLPDPPLTNLKHRSTNKTKGKSNANTTPPAKSSHPRQQRNPVIQSPFSCGETSSLQSFVRHRQKLSFFNKCSKTLGPSCRVIFTNIHVWQLICDPVHPCVEPLPNQKIPRWATKKDKKNRQHKSTGTSFFFASTLQVFLSRLAFNLTSRFVRRSATLKFIVKKSHSLYFFRQESTCQNVGSSKLLMFKIH